LTLRVSCARNALLEVIQVRGSNAVGGAAGDLAKQLLHCVHARPDFVSTFVPAPVCGTLQVHECSYTSTAALFLVSAFMLAACCYCLHLLQMS
jgi:hypothetical protein